jgi:hypothetical protein
METRNHREKASSRNRHKGYRKFALFVPSGWDGSSCPFQKPLSGTALQLIDFSALGSNAWALPKPLVFEL